jgi:transcriptional regulator with XRE-family HTH domain
MTNDSNQTRQISIGAQIRERRNAKNYSQQQLAWKIGVDKTTISAWERDVRFPNEDNLLHLSTVLGLSFHNLYMKADDRKMVG